MINQIIIKLDFTKLKTALLKTLLKNEKTSHRREKITVIHISDIGLVPTIYKEVLKLLEDKQSNF